MTDLERATEYSIRLQAMTVNGTGPATAWLTAETYAHNLDGKSDKFVLYNLHLLLFVYAMH